MIILYDFCWCTFVSGNKDLTVDYSPQTDGIWTVDRRHLEGCTATGREYA